MAFDEREKLFINEYIINKGNAYQAALKAGYKENTAKHAYQWLEEDWTHINPTKKRHLPFKPELKKKIKEKLDEINSGKTADAQEVIEFLTSVMRGEHTEQTLRLVGEGVQEITNIAVPEKDRIKAAELLGKVHMIFVNKEEQKARIDKIRAETARIKGEELNEEQQDDGFIAALKSEVAEVWEE